MNVGVIKKLLKNTKEPMSQIAKKFDLSARTVSNINKGLTHFDKNENYPLRITAQKKSQLKNRLSIPNKNAVRNPNILSPQLLDYIGFLSVLEVGIECLLEFREVYNEQLEKSFSRELSDKEVLAIIELRPTRPAQLKEMINAYTNPKVKFINKEYWVETGFIDKSEEDLLYSILM